MGGGALFKMWVTITLFPLKKQKLDPNWLTGRCRAPGIGPWPWDSEPLLNTTLHLNIIDQFITHIIANIWFYISKIHLDILLVELFSVYKVSLAEQFFTFLYCISYVSLHLSVLPTAVKATERNSQQTLCVFAEPCWSVHLKIPVTSKKILFTLVMLVGWLHVTCHSNQKENGWRCKWDLKIKSD